MLAEQELLGTLCECFLLMKKYSKSSLEYKAGAKLFGQTFNELRDTHNTPSQFIAHRLATTNQLDRYNNGQAMRPFQTFYLQETT